MKLFFKKQLETYVSRKHVSIFPVYALLLS